MHITDLLPLGTYSPKQQQFIIDLSNDFEVVHYEDRGYYQGPAVFVEFPGILDTYTSVRILYDNVMGHTPSYVGYPG